MRNHFWRRMAAISTALWLAFALPTAAWAHPLGNFTINHFAGLHVTQQDITVDYILDMAEIPAFQEIALFDANGNGQPDVAESATYHAAKCESLRSDLDLHVNNQSATLALSSSNIEFPPGAGGLLTLRLSCIFNASLTNEASNISFTDNAYPDRIGWREIVVTGPDPEPLLKVVRSRFLPNKVVALADGKAKIPLLEGREPVNGKAAAYVCENMACKKPVTDPAELEALLK